MRTRIAKSRLKSTPDKGECQLDDILDSIRAIPAAIHEQTEAIRDLEGILATALTLNPYPVSDSLADQLLSRLDAIRDAQGVIHTGDGDAPVKIWAKGGVQLVNPIVMNPEKKPQPPKHKRTTGDDIRQRFSDKGGSHDQR